jgi:hypothetical protein
MSKEELKELEKSQSWTERLIPYVRIYHEN